MAPSRQQRTIRRQCWSCKYFGKEKESSFRGEHYCRAILRRKIQYLKRTDKSYGWDLPPEELVEEQTYACDFYEKNPQKLR